MKNFGIDLNDNAQHDRKHNKIEKAVIKIVNVAKNQKTDFENYLIKNMDDEDILEMHIDDYFKGIDYKIPSHKNYTHEKKPLKHKYYYE